jgi:hypothetical protein
MDPIQARQTLERLKRGVPPTSAIDELSVGMSGLQEKLDRLLAEDATPRWFLVQSEYGEGKSHFHSFSRDHALRAGYATASLDVNNDNGALHQPQRHLAIILDSLRSPLPQFRNIQGFAELMRCWLDVSDPADQQRVLKHLASTQAWAPAGRDPDNLLTYVRYMMQRKGPATERQWLFPHAMGYLAAEDLLNKSSHARFAASYRLQVVHNWLIATGHKGLLLFVDEVDNVIRQIHAKAHAGCFRTLAWYCSCPAFPRLRVVFASTPEVITMLDSWGRHQYLHTLRSQKTVTEQEVSVYEQWNREASRLSGDGWQTCPRLTLVQRKQLFEKISRFHQEAWSWSAKDLNGKVEEFARRPEFRTARRWVRVAVQLLDVLQQTRS